jgi:hypothetical protein
MYGRLQAGDGGTSTMKWRYAIHNPRDCSNGGIEGHTVFRFKEINVESASPWVKIMIIGAWVE